MRSESLRGNAEGRRPRPLTGGHLATVLALLCTVAVALTARAEVTVTTDDERPLRGEVVRLHVLDDGAPAPGHQVVAVYRPNSQTEHRERLPAVDASGTVLWTPRDAGPVTLEVWPPDVEVDVDGDPLLSLTVAVRYGGFPASGMLIMILAGLLLFGGATTAFILLLRPPSHIPAEEPPST